MFNTILILLTKFNYCLLQERPSSPKYNFPLCVKRVSKTERCKCDPSVPDLSSVRSQLATVSSVAFSTQPYQPYWIYSKIILPFLQLQNVSRLNENTFYPMLPDFGKVTALLDGSQSSPICLTYKNNM